MRPSVGRTAARRGSPEPLREEGGDAFPQRVAGLAEPRQLLRFAPGLRRVGQGPVEAADAGGSDRADLLGAERDHRVGGGHRDFGDRLRPGAGDVQPGFREDADRHRVDLPGMGAGALHPDAGGREFPRQGFGQLAARRVGDAEEHHQAFALRGRAGRRRRAGRGRRGHGAAGWYGGYPSGAPDRNFPKPLARFLRSGRPESGPPSALRVMAGCRRSPALLPLAAAAAFAFAFACGGGDRPRDPAPARESPAPAPPSPVEAPADDRPAIVAFGDSLTAGYGMEIDEAWPARLQERLDREGLALRVVNAGVSGETSSGGLRRLPWVLDREPAAQVLVLALGGNDGLRGVPASVMADNLRAMIREAEGRGLSILLAGVPTAPELGPDYAEEFRAAFREVADETRTPFLENLLDGVAGDPALNQRDRIHPNAEGARRLADNVFAVIAPLLEPAPAEPSDP